MANKLIKKSTRRHKRFPVHLGAEVMIGGAVYEGIVGNVSEEGLAYTMTTFIQADKGFCPRGDIDVFITIPSGAALTLRCEIRWFLKPSEEGKSLLLGMKILEPSSKYKDWVKELELRLGSEPEA